MQTGKKEIKIFVSRRIDIQSEVIPNPLFVQVRCGAVFDKGNGSDLQGDDTGENISERRMTFCEFTVQYWAWKNVCADYYGLCHYRRYLSFSEKRFASNEFNMVYVPSFMPRDIRRFGWNSPDKMEKLIASYDIVANEPADVRKMPTPKGKVQTVYELWVANDGELIKKEALELLLGIIKERWPKYSQSAREYLGGSLHRGYNCYVLRKELFDRLCEMQFDIMFEVERRLDTTRYTQTLLRAPAFMGEIVYGIFIYHLVAFENRTIKDLQMVYFNNIDAIGGKLAVLGRYVQYWGDKALRAVFDPLLPKGSNRREVIKKAMYAVLPVKRRGVAFFEDG